jgi:putative sporulation protein yqfD
MKRRIQAADSIRFCVRGRGAQRLLGQAAQTGLKLERIAPQADGFTAVVSGAGWAKLCQLAGAGGWQVIQMQRRGPGPLAERLLRRPGILAGIGLFFVLLHWLGGFLWCMNLELLTVPQQESIRTLLAQSGIWEGCRPSQAELAQAQQLLEASGDFGWVSLNFTGGCLTAEGTPPSRHRRNHPPRTPGFMPVQAARCLL